jgi:CheY-like chemotaxis protein
MKRIEERLPIDRGLRSLRKRVLVVDDEYYIRDILLMLFQACDCEVDLAVNGKEGLEKATAQVYDIVVSDIRMPKMNGIEFHEQLLKREPQFSGLFVFISGELDTAECRELVKKTNRPFLTKPFLPGDLLRLMPAAV